MPLLVLCVWWHPEGVRDLSPKSSCGASLRNQRGRPRDLLFVFLRYNLIFAEPRRDVNAHPALLSSSAVRQPIGFCGCPTRRLHVWVRLVFGQTLPFPPGKSRRDGRK